MKTVTTDDLNQRRGLVFFGTNIDHIEVNVKNRNEQIKIDKSWTPVILIGVFFTIFLSLPALLSLFDTRSDWSRIFELAKLPLYVVAITAIIYLPTHRCKLLFTIKKDSVDVKNFGVFRTETKLIPWDEFLGVHMRVHRYQRPGKAERHADGRRIPKKVYYYQIVELIHPDTKYWLPIYIEEGRNSLPHKMWKEASKALGLPAYYARGDHLVVKNKKTQSISISRQVEQGKLSDNFDTSQEVPRGIEINLISAYGEEAMRIDIAKPTPHFFRLGSGVLGGLALTAFGVFISTSSDDLGPALVLGIFGLPLALIPHFPCNPLI